MNSANPTARLSDSSPSPPLTQFHQQVEEGAILLGKYRVDRKLGEGAMGAAWLVEHLTLDLQRVIKVINPALVQDPGIRLRFAQEAKMMAKLNGHPNAVLVHDADVDAHGMAFIVMDYLRGAPLRASLTSGEPRPLDWVARITYQLCDVLQEAHRKHRIVHRDLKPENVMLIDGQPGEEVVKVLDFGIAKVIRDEASAENATNILHTAGVLGTVAYASPEQNDFDETGTHPPVDGRSDLYSLGVMIYEMLTGLRPFRGNLTKLLYDHARTPPPPFSEVAPGLNLPPEVEAVVMKCLSKKPEERYQSAADLQAAFIEAAARVLPYAVLTPSYLRTPIPAHASGEHIATLSAPPVVKPRRAPIAAMVALPSLAVLIALGVYWNSANHDRTPSVVHDPLPKLLKVDPSLEQHLKNQGYEISPDTKILDGKALGLKTGGIPENLSRPVEGSLSLAYLWNPALKLYLPEGYQVDEHANLARDGWPQVLLRTVRLATGEESTLRFLRIEGTEPGNPFAMGDFHKGPNGTDLSHKVELSGYYMQENEVSIFEIRAGPLYGTRNSTPTSFQEYLSNLPSNGISDLDSLAYPAASLDRKAASLHASAFNALLPTEAQWEYAARSRGQNHEFVGGETDSSLVWASSFFSNFDVAGETKTCVQPVNSPDFPRDVTEQGIRYLTGNVQEWCRDRYVDLGVLLTGHDSVATDPCEPVQGPGDDVVVRGGSGWDESQAHYTTYGRFHRKLGDTREDLGFRLVLECPTPYSPASREVDRP